MPARPARPPDSAEDGQGQASLAEAREAGRARRTADDADLVAEHGSGEDDGRHADGRERDEHAGVKLRALDQARQRRLGIEVDRHREIEACGVAPRAAHEVVERQLGHIDQHQARQDLGHAERDEEDRRDQGIERAADRAERQHDGKDPAATEHALEGAAMGGEGQCAPEGAARDELTLGTDVPEVGAKAEREPDRDHDQRRGLHGQRLERPVLRQGSTK